MTNQKWKPWLIGAFAGLAVFSALKTLDAFQQSFDVPSIASDPAKFYDRAISITGLPVSVSQRTKYVGYGKPEIPVVSFYMHEPAPAGDKYAKHGDRYIAVEVPAASMRNLPNEDETFTISGTFKAPTLVGNLESQ
jgi:hypothetical protein